MGKVNDDVLGNLNSSKQPSLVTEMVAGMFGMDAGKVQAARAAQPSLLGELMAAGREGREDFWNMLIPAFPQASPVREPGTPGNPTQLMTNDQLGMDEIERDQGRGR